MQNSSFETDVVIIGAGPVGLFGIFQCGMMGLHCHVIDALEKVGGQCIALYPEKPIYDIPAYPRIEAQELIRNLEAQAAPFHPVYHLGQQVISVQKHEDGTWEIQTSKRVVLRTKTIIIAAGVGAFGPKKPPLEGIEAYEGKSVHYFVSRRDHYKDKRIVIAGGGDSAVDWALSLSEIAAHVMVVHRRAKFRAAPESEKKLTELSQAGKIELVVPYQLKRLEGHEGQLTSVVVETLEGKERALQADYLLPFFGLSMNLGPIAEWGLHLDKNHIVVEAATAGTNHPGIYAIGDIANYPGKQKLILTGFAEAAQAAHAARAYIHPEVAWHFEYSTTRGVPEAEKS